MTELIEEINAFIVKYQSHLHLEPHPPNNENDISDMRSLSNNLAQLSFNPDLISNDDFINDLYKAFSYTESLFNKYGQSLMLFDLGLVMAGLYERNENVLPPEDLQPLFGNARESHSLLVNLVEGPTGCFSKIWLAIFKLGSTL